MNGREVPKEGRVNRAMKRKVTVIAGGEGPLGREVSKKFLAEGAKVLIGWYAEQEWEEAKGSLAAIRGVRRDAGRRNQGRSGSKTDAEGKGDIWSPRYSASHGGNGGTSATPFVKHSAILRRRRMEDQLEERLSVRKHAIESRSEKKRH